MVNLKKREYIVGENIVEQLKAFKHELTRKKWNGFVTWLEDNVQYESVFKEFVYGLKFSVDTPILNFTFFLF